MQLDTLIIVGVLVAGFGLLYFLLKKTQAVTQEPKQMEQMINQIFGLTANQLMEQSRQVLSSERESIRVDLNNKQQTIETLVRDLKQDLAKRQDEIRLLEQDRNQKFTELRTTLDSHRELTQQLSVSTQELAKVLSNNQQRGEWGERI
ncbi:MAG: DNA recombination protein RmuC, partial [bacterium]|nr:DNA recombination protein RmuC [bacterium]